MKWHVFMIAFGIGALALHTSAFAASLSAEDFYDMVTEINKASETNLQHKYSAQLHRSINAAAIQHLEQNCASAHPDTQVQTFTLLGLMRLDGVFKSPSPLPENSFTECVAGKMNLVTFPLPPGSGRGWPVAIQFDGTTGGVLYLAGDKQPALPRYSGPASRTSMPWVYTPAPVLPKSLRKPCDMNVWVSVEEGGYVSDVDVSDSTCPDKFSKAVAAAAGQWLYMEAGSTSKVEPRDVRLSFNVQNNRFHIKF